MELVLIILTIGLVVWDIRNSSKRFDEISSAIDGVAVNGPLVRIENKDMRRAGPMTKRAKRAMIERYLKNRVK